MPFKKLFFSLRSLRSLAAAACLALALAACAQNIFGAQNISGGQKTPAGAPLCRVVLEQSDAFTADTLTAAVPVGQSVSFTLKPASGYTLTGADHADAVLARTAAGYTLTLPAVRYSTALAVTAQRSAVSLFYNAGDADGAWVEIPVTPSHARVNTSQGTSLFTKPNHTLTGWNTAEDGSGTAVGLGSRAQPGARLYAQWAAWNDAAEFTFTLQNGAATVTGWRGQSETLVVPQTLGGVPVTALAAGAFAGAPCTRVVLPPTLRRIEPNAFAGCAVQTLTLFDTLREVTDYAFCGCTALQTLHLNAATAPVYSASYYASFADKFDRLRALAGQQKLVLFSGSSARFGYDCAALDAGLPSYGVVNMGVFAYTNALPQLEVLRTQMRRGDILLLSPEFDAAKRQFCTTNALDEDFFCMMEADYDTLALLDLRGYTGVFSALGSYLKIRAGMRAADYALSPADFDEAGDPVATPSYNAYGDYILYRPNASDDAPIYGLPVDYTVQAFPQNYYLDAANAAWRPFAQDGVRVYLTYSPRNRLAVSANSTPAAVAALDEYLCQNLEIPILGTLADSLLPGRYFYGTDNHLSTQGVAKRTQAVLRDLTAQLQKEGASP